LTGLPHVALCAATNFFACSSEGLLAGPQTLTAALGECAGEVGDHGKWMDFMIPFIRRCENETSQANQQLLLYIGAVACPCFRLVPRLSVLDISTPLFAKFMLW